MFSKSRPVPSRAALRVLYQLAYISSGTAVGVAALCAEERRRRTHYVQKIADNAKRLRQSPRHVHNVAARGHATVAEQAAGDDVGFWEEQSGEEFDGAPYAEEEHSPKKKKRRRKKVGVEDGPGERLVRAPEMPSAVERGYAQITKARDEASLRSASEKASTEVSRQAGTQANVETRDQRRARAWREAQVKSPSHSGLIAKRTEGYDLKFANGNETSRILSAERTKATDRPSRKERRATQALEDTPVERFKIPTLSIPSGLHPPPNFHLEAAAELVQSGLNNEVRPDTLARAAVNHDVALFFERMPWTSSDLKTEALVASRLMSACLRERCIIDLRDLVSWKLANDRLDEQDVTLLYEGYPELASTGEGLDNAYLFELFTELFQSKAYGKLSEQLRLTTAISVAASAVHWDPDVTTRDRFNRACALLAPTLRSARSDTIDEILQTLCNQSLTDGQALRAFDLVKIVRQASDGTYASHNRRWKDVYEKIMDYATNHGQLHVCARYINMLLRAGDDPSWIPMFERLLRDCRQRETYAPVMKKFSLDVLRSSAWKALTDEGKVNLAIALSSMQHFTLTGHLEQLFLAIPEALRGPVVEAWCAGKMQRVWKTTQDLAAVWKEYFRVRGLQSGRFGVADLTLIEICNRAGQPDQAMRRLKLLQYEHNHQSLCVAAVSLARKSAWEQLRGLMDIIAKTGKLINDSSTGRNLNDVIDIYSRRHTAAETWKFVSDMIKTIGFVPNRITTDIMLRCFVSKHTLSLIPSWLQYLKGLGHDFQMNSRTVEKLLSCYYFEQRPPHELVMWFSRNLVHKWPAFDASELTDLIKAAIGYDLRTLDVQDKAEAQVRAQQNLARLAEAGCTIPVPYQPKRELEVFLGREEEPVEEFGASELRHTTRYNPHGVEVEHGVDSEQCGVENSISDHATHDGDQERSADLMSDKSVGEPPMVSEATDTRQDQVEEHREQSSTGCNPQNMAAEQDSDSGVAKFEPLLPPDDAQKLNTAPKDPQPYDIDAPISTGWLSEAPLGEEVTRSESFTDLRPQYHVNDYDDDGDDPDMADSEVPAYILDKKRQRRELRNMILALQRDHCTEVLSLYQDSLSPTGLPPSPIALEVATEASIRLHKGNTTEALAMISAAKEAGMEVRRSMGPLLIQQILNLEGNGKKDANQLRVMVIDYYRMNEEHGFPVKHHVGITAANKLINNGRAEYGINILNAIYRSEWVLERELGIVAMTVYLKGYAALKSEAGVGWVLEKVFWDNMRIDRKFILAIKRACEEFGKRERLRHGRVRVEEGRFLRRLREGRKRCILRRYEQRVETKRFGNELVRMILEGAGVEWRRVSSKFGRMKVRRARERRMEMRGRGEMEVLEEELRSGCIKLGVGEERDAGEVETTV